MGAGELEVFAAVAELRSFSAAARRLQLTTAAVSKIVARLEARLGVRLLTRTTRRVVPTPEGEELHRHAQDIVARIAEAESAVAGGAAGLRGEVRISAPVLIGQQVLAPLLSELRLSHPEIVIDLHLTDEPLDLVRGGIDLALRLGELPDSGLVARRLATTRFVTCASPAYLARHGTPETIAQLAHHSCVTYVVQRTGRPFAWRFVSGSFEPPRSVMVGDGGANRACAIAGLGIIQEIDIAVAPDLASGALVPVLTDQIADGPPLSLVQPAGRFATRRVRAVGEYLAAAMRRPLGSAPS